MIKYDRNPMSEALHSLCLSSVGVQWESSRSPFGGNEKKYVKIPLWKFCWNPVGIGGEVISTAWYRYSVNQCFTAAAMPRLSLCDQASTTCL